MAAIAPTEPAVFWDDAFPASSRKATGSVAGVAAEAEMVYFADKILVTISQGGRLSQWIQVPLSAPSSASLDATLPAAMGFRTGNAETSLLPSTHLTPRTLFGGGGEARETFGQLLAAQVGSLLALRDPADQRTLVLGLGLEMEAGGGRGSSSSNIGSADKKAQAVYFDAVELVQRLL